MTGRDDLMLFLSELALARKKNISQDAMLASLHVSAEYKSLLPHDTSTVQPTETQCEGSWLRSGLLPLHNGVIHIGSDVLDDPGQTSVDPTFIYV